MATKRESSEFRVQSSKFKVQCVTPTDSRENLHVLLVNLVSSVLKFPSAKEPAKQKNKPPLRLSNLLQIVFILFLLTNTCPAQDPYPVLSMEVSTEPVANHLTPDSLPLLTDTTIFDVVMHVNLFDTLNIQQIEVKIGSVQGASDIFSNNFVFDASPPPIGGLTYFRDEYSIRLGLGTMQQMLSYYAVVRIQRTNGSYSESVEFNR